ncbi:MAG: dihydropteroate synthase [Candidatus Lokiarchaeota archaeon]|nr:dihydropteroate synthase [Candidatus Lokiarchaeota archaeon]
MQIETNIKGVKIGDKYIPKILGVINLSKESFYKQSITTDTDTVLKKVEMFLEEGVHFIDIGARSTAPGVKPISIKEELNKLLPPLKAVLDNFRVPISVDTQYSKIAEKALTLGASIINDVSGFRTDPDIMKVIVEHDAHAIIMASKKVPGDCLGIKSIKEELQKSINDIETLGLNSNNLIIDPGIGRWIPSKVYGYNLEIINELQELRPLNKSILVAISRKSFIGDILNYPDPKNRLIGTIASTSIAVYNGAHIIRAHDVKETKEAIEISWKIKNYKNYIS